MSIPMYFHSWITHILASVPDDTGRVHELADIVKPIKGSYIVLESVSKEKHYSRSVHVLTPKDTCEFKIGRGHTADIKLNDVSVSRVHSYIGFDNTSKTFSLKDNDSKFGTLVLLDGKQDIAMGKPLSIQINKTVLTFAVKNSKVCSAARLETGYNSAPSEVKSS